MGGEGGGDNGQRRVQLTLKEIPLIGKDIRFTREN